MIKEKENLAGGGESVIIRESSDKAVLLKMKLSRIVMDFVKEALANGEINSTNDLYDVLSMPAESFSLVGRVCLIADDFEETKKIFEAAYEGLKSANDKASRMMKEKQENGGLDPDGCGAADGK